MTTIVDNKVNAETGSEKVLYEIGKQIPEWSSIKENLIDTEALMSCDLFSQRNLGVCFVYYKDMNKIEIEAIDKSPFIVGVGDNVSSVVDIKFLKEQLYLTACINTKLQTPNVLHDSEAWYSLRVIAVESTTGEIKAIRGCELPPAIARNLNKIIEAQEPFNVEQLNRAHQSFLWQNPMHALCENTEYVKIGF